MNASTNNFRKTVFGIFFMLMLSFSLLPYPSSGQEVIGGDIVCHCTIFGKCKASGGGNNCAVGDPNVNCQDYNGNC